MDGDGTSLQTYQDSLRDLARLNVLTLTHRATIGFLDRATRTLPRGAHISILDVAYGHGDLLRAIHRWAAKRGLAATLEGIDLNPRSAQVAIAATPPEMCITYRTIDVFSYAPSPLPDLIVSSQFTHHLTDAEVVRFLGWLAQFSVRGWFIADLHRHPIPYYGFPLLARIFGWHRIVRNDGRISIARGFTRAEWTGLLEKSGIEAYVTWHFPFRHGIACLK